MGLFFKLPIYCTLYGDIMLDDFIGDKKRKKRVKKLDFDSAFYYWRDALYEKMLNIFKWDGLSETVPQKEIEQALIVRGFCGIINKGAKLWAVTGARNGITPYADEFIYFDYSNPILSSGQLRIRTLNLKGDCCIISNNFSCLPTLRLIDRYAYLLAHSDLTIQSAMINSRSMGTIAVDSDQQAKSVEAWYNKLINGDTVAVVDNNTFDTPINSGGIRNIAGSNNATNVLDTLKMHDYILREFYSDIGLPMSRDKKEREIESETTMDNYRILFNVKDMLALRQEGCRNVNELYGVNWSVRLSDEYVIMMDNMGGKSNDDKTVSD